MSHKVVYLVLEQNRDDFATVHAVAPTYEKAKEFLETLSEYEKLFSDIEEVKWYE